MTPPRAIIAAGLLLWLQSGLCCAYKADLAKLGGAK